MSRSLPAALLTLLVLACALSGQERPAKAKIKTVDADKGSITLTIDGKDRDFTVTDDTRLIDVAGKAIADRLKDKGLKEGAEVLYRSEQKNGKDVLLGLKLAGGGDADIRRAKIKKIDLDKMIVTLTVGDKDQEFLVTEDTTLFGAEGKDVKDRLKTFKEGAEVLFRPSQKDGKDVLVGLKLGGANDNLPPAQPKVDTSKLKPLTELGLEEYQGYKGGLYPDGKNDRPAAHEEAGQKLAKKVQSLDADGKPNKDGKIVMLSVGMSNTSQESTAFQKELTTEKERNPQLLFVNGAQGGMTAQAIQDPEKGPGQRYWSVVDERLKTAGVTREQVQVIWIKEADAGPNQGFPKYAEKLQGELRNIVQLFPKRFPNARLVYLSSRTYAGWATTPLNPEPYAYESGFSVKWLIEQQLKGEAALNYDAGKGAVKAPWLSWGPYLWANGTTKRADGFSYAESDFGSDGTHPSPAGQEKVAKLMLQFFKTDSTTKPWVLRRSSE